MKTRCNHCNSLRSFRRILRDLSLDTPFRSHPFGLRVGRASEPSGSHSSSPVGRDLLHTCGSEHALRTAALLRLAGEESLTSRFDAGVLEDWRGVPELVAARNSRLGSVD
jgi:hypothetical protein